jgi:hypothetical protein
MIAHKHNLQTDSRAATILAGYSACGISSRRRHRRSGSALPRGVNDPRVDVWTSLKFAARVQ